MKWAVDKKCLGEGTFKKYLIKFLILNMNFHNKW
jgi:hypothetical protein